MTLSPRKSAPNVRLGLANDTNFHLALALRWALLHFIVALYQESMAISTFSDPISPIFQRHPGLYSTAGYFLGEKFYIYGFIILLS